MSVFLYKNNLFKEIPYKSEAALEKAINEVKEQLFGPNRVYLDIKKKIGARGKQRNIPDGYLIDLNSKQPKLYVVENELSTHDHLRHIAVQILQFSMAFEDEPLRVRGVLFDAISNEEEIHEKFQEYIKNNKFRNLDHLLDFLVHEADFAALVIIDDIPENLENVLASKFAFGVEILELKQYEDPQKNIAYGFNPFLEDVNADIEVAGQKNKDAGQLDTSQIDTVVVPAREEGFQKVFLGQDCWHAIRLHGAMRPQIKYIAAYQVAPVSAITHMATVDSIEPWKDTGKYVVYFSEPAKKIGPVKLKKQGKVKAPQNLRYTTRERLLAAKTLDDVW